MILELQGNYFLKVEFGGTVIPIQPQMIREISITQDLNTILPTFRIAFQDAGGTLINLIPYDKDLNDVFIVIGKTLASNTLNAFKFKVLRRQGKDGVYEIAGHLDVPNLINTTECRGWKDQTVKKTLEDLALKEMFVQSTEVGASLSKVKNIIQPAWTTAKLLNYLKTNLIGREGEKGYFSYIKNIASEQIFVFKSIEELYSGPIKYKFVVGEEGYVDLIPILTYEIFDDSSLIANFGAKSQKYGYFDYATGTPTYDAVTIEEVPGITEFFTINNDDTSNGDPQCTMGRSNSFTDDFKGVVGGGYTKRLSTPLKMWATTWGQEGLAPGDLVQVVFSESMNKGNLFVYQHTGNWMIERVVHFFDTSFHTLMLLTRGGIDSDFDSALTSVMKRIKR